MRPGDLVARLGGDELTVLCENVASDHEALAIARRLREAFDHAPADRAPARRRAGAARRRPLHRNSLRDWNRRPLVGRASRQSRPSPWATT